MDGDARGAGAGGGDLGAGGAVEWEGVRGEELDFFSGVLRHFCDAGAAGIDAAGADSRAGIGGNRGDGPGGDGGEEGGAEVGDSFSRRGTKEQQWTAHAFVR